MRFRIILLLIAACWLAVPGYAEEEFSSRREFFLHELRHAIDLNEEYKATSSAMSQEERIQAMQESEKYLYSTLFPLLSDSIFYSCVHDDIEVLSAFFDTIISYSNSANEQFSVSCGELFLLDPDLVFEVIINYSKEDKELLVGSIEFGVDNVLYNDDVSEERQRKIDQDFGKLYEITGLEPMPKN